VVSWPGSPSALEISLDPPVAEAAVLVASTTYGEIDCAPPLVAGEAAISFVAYPHVASAA
jgi:hypothetical protein